jgi:MFS transporter, DHA3 family, macrolide efflux protein
MVWFRQSAMQRFSMIWLGQMLSMMGTATSRFALLIWAYEHTGQATTVALLGFFSYILYIVLSPLAGVLVDRLDRRLLIIGGDLGAALMTLIVYVLYGRGELQIGHLYLAQFLVGGFEAFQLPAYQATITQLIPKEQYARANGMRSFSESAAQVLAPVFAALLLNPLGLGGVLLIDLLSFGFAVLPFLFIMLPKPAGTAQQGESTEGWRASWGAGWRYIRQRPGLRNLLIIYAIIGLAAALTYYGVLDAMILARTAGDETVLGFVKAALGLGGVVGGVVMSVWGGPKRRIHGVLLLGGISFLIGDFLTGVGRSTWVWMAAEFFATFFVPFIVACHHAIWQTKVIPAMQGRVFAIQGMLQRCTLALGYLLAGPLADQVFEPAMRSGGVLSGVFGGLLGTGPGAGMGLMFLCTALLGGAVCFGGYLIPSVRHIERDLPDGDATNQTA